ncbi:MAG TPA: hypothetical protein VIJ51_16025 [Solirubrobacteraceae bacterium]
MRPDRRPARLSPTSVAIVVGALLAGVAGVASAAPTVGARTGAYAAATVGGTPTIPVIAPNPPGKTTGPVPHVPSAPLSLADQVIGLPSASRCVKSLRVGLARPKGVRLRSLSIAVGKRHVKRRPVPKSITFHELPKGHFTLAVTVTTTTGRHLSRSRRYARCR